MHYGLNRYQFDKKYLKNFDFDIGKQGGYINYSAYYDKLNNKIILSNGKNFTFQSYVNISSILNDIGNATETYNITTLNNKTTPEVFTLPSNILYIPEGINYTNLDPSKTFGPGVTFRIVINNVTPPSGSFTKIKFIGTFAEVDGRFKHNFTIDSNGKINYNDNGFALLSSDNNKIKYIEFS